MNRRPLVLLAALAALGAAAGDASAAGEPCATLAVATDARVAARWPALPDEIRRAFDGRRDIDGCARVAVTMPADALAVEVKLLDGRAAARSVSGPEDLLTTLQALLLVPAAPPVVVRERSSATPGALAAAPESPPTGIGIELSVMAGTRIGDDQMGAGLGVLSLIDVTGWLAGFAARADAYQASDGTPGAGALVLALLGGRRLRSGTLSLDLTAGPALALLGTMTSVTQMAPATTPVIRESTDLGSVPRLLATARLNFRARSVIRPFVGIDGEVGPVGQPPPPLSAPREIDQLPRWTVGLLVGATAGSR